MISQFPFSLRSTTSAAVLLLTLAGVRAAQAATVTLTAASDGTELCFFGRAVASINAGVDQYPCTHTGTYRSNDTVVVPVGTWHISAPVDITRSMTIHGGGKWSAYLATNVSALSYAIFVKDPSIVVKMGNYRQ